MGYACYTRKEGRGVIDVQPTVTIRFDQMHTITLNRIRKCLEDNLCLYGWSSKVSAVFTSLQGHHDVCTSYLDQRALDAFAETGGFKELQAKLLLLEHKIEFGAYRPYLGYKGVALYDDPDRGAKSRMAREMIATVTGPIIKGLTDHDTQQKILEALDNRAPYSFAGIPRRC